jgi:hypothetical protein
VAPAPAKRPATAPAATNGNPPRRRTETWQPPAAPQGIGWAPFRYPPE